jgi:hypothetical protein
MECDGPRCEIDECGSGCSILCSPGRTCRIGECTEAGCHIGPAVTGAEQSILEIAKCSGGQCNLECGPGATCTIGTCPGGDCTITCAEGATCNCSATGCTVVTP